MVAEDFKIELKGRLKNPAVPDSEILQYITSAMRNVKPQNYSHDDYIEQVLDVACQKLANDGKFPEVTGIVQNGLSTSFAPNDPERYRRQIAARRATMIIGKGAGV